MEKEIKRKIRSKAEAQSLADFLWNEKERHLDDINDIVKDLLHLKMKYDVRPRMIRSENKQR
jgi:hypothetical protein